MQKELKFFMISYKIEQHFVFLQKIHHSVVTQIIELANVSDLFNVTAHRFH